MEGNNDYFTVNLSLTNNGDSPIKAQLLYTNNSPIIDTPNDYKFTIARFSAPGGLIPLFKPIIPDPAFPLRTNMSITLKFNTSYFREYVDVTPDEVKTGIFGYNLFLERVNAASTTAFAALKAAFPAATPTVAPKFFMDPKTELISMYVQDSYIQGSSDYVGVGVNQYLDQILNLSTSSFVSNGPSGYDAEISVTSAAVVLPASGSRTGFPSALQSLAGTYLQVSQEYPSLSSWSQIKSLIFTTNMLPVIPEILPTNSTQSQSGNFGSNTLLILTDFDFNKDGGPINLNQINYIPTVFRFKDIATNAPFSVIDMQCFYQDYLGNIYPLELPVNSNISMKIMFERKSSSVLRLGLFKFFRDNLVGFFTSLFK